MDFLKDGLLQLIDLAGAIPAILIHASTSHNSHKFVLLNQYFRI